jgi:hypothetical protein
VLVFAIAATVAITIAGFLGVRVAFLLLPVCVLEARAFSVACDTVA